ncbi:MAG: dihydroorotase, partial [Pseudomonadota bacterium]|nr:dihydroorotase [Pseudomonadota bacterium]
MNIFIHHGRVIDPASQHDNIADLYIVDNKIAAIGQAPKNFKPDQTINARS